MMIAGAEGMTIMSANTMIDTMSTARKEPIASVSGNTSPQSHVVTPFFTSVVPTMIMVEMMM